MKKILWLCCAVAVIGCGDDSDVGPDAGTDSGIDPDASVNPDELFAPGPYDVGYRETELEYSAAASGESRTIPVRVWYPAAPHSDDEKAEYAVAGIVTLPNDFAYNEPRVAEGGPFPTAVYSHGSGGEALLAYPFGELMASHGWVVASPNHVGNTTLDGINMMSTPFARTALNRPADITAVIDWLESGLVADALTGAADTSGVFVFGHSFGGYTTLAIGGADQDFDQLSSGCDAMSMDDNCVTLEDSNVEAAYRAGFGDPRVVAIAPQAPAVVPTIIDGALADLEIPTMLMSGNMDLTTPDATQAIPAWMGLDHPEDVWVRMPTGAHFTFISICHDLDIMLLEGIQPGVTEDGCGDQFIPSEDAVPVLGAYLLAFGRRHVLGQTEWDSVLKGPPLDERFDVTTR